MAALLKPSDLVTQALVDGQQGTDVPALIITITTLRLSKSSQT